LLRVCFIVLLALTLDLPGTLTVEARDGANETIEQGQTESARTRRTFRIPRSAAISPVPSFSQHHATGAPAVPREIVTGEPRHRDHRRTPAANPTPPAVAHDDH
jgi:hypothetical protein